MPVTRRRRRDPAVAVILGLALVAALGFDGLARPADRVVTDIGPCELREVRAGGHFRHDGELWVRLAPDVGLDADGRARCLAARLTGPEQGRAEPVPVFARCWVRQVAIDVTRTRNDWE